MTNIITGNSKGELKGEDKVDRYVVHLQCMDELGAAQLLYL